VSTEGEAYTTTLITPAIKQPPGLETTRGSAMAEGLRDALVSRNSATTIHPI